MLKNDDLKRIATYLADKPEPNRSEREMWPHIATQPQIEALVRQIQTLYAEVGKPFDALAFIDVLTGQASPQQVLNLLQQIDDLHQQIANPRAA